MHMGSIVVIKKMFSIILDRSSDLFVVTLFQCFKVLYIVVLFSFMHRICAFGCVLIVKVVAEEIDFIFFNNLLVCFLMTVWFAIITIDLQIQKM